MSLRSKWAAAKAVRAGLAVGRPISGSIRNRRATPPPAHFQRNPPGRGPLAVFRRCKRQSGSDLGPYEFRYGHFARALKNSQLTCGDMPVIYETMHQTFFL
jgi:hypothetical protein